MEANSTPRAPAPTTISVFGIRGAEDRTVRENGFVGPGSMPGRDFASEPLTIRIWRLRSPSSCVLLDADLPGPSYLPPCTHSTLFFS